MDRKIGLCETCRHAQAIRSDRGSIFYLCRMHFEDRLFPKYPRLPVMRCEGYRQKEPPVGESSPTAL